MTSSIIKRKRGGNIYEYFSNIYEKFSDNDEISLTYNIYNNLTKPGLTVYFFNEFVNINNYINLNKSY